MMLERTFNRIMLGAKTPEGKVIAILLTISLALMTWNATSIKAAFAEDQEQVPAASETVSDKAVEPADQNAGAQDIAAPAAEEPQDTVASEPEADAADEAVEADAAADDSTDIVESDDADTQDADDEAVAGKDEKSDSKAAAKADDSDDKAKADADEKDAKDKDAKDADDKEKDEEVKYPAVTFPAKYANGVTVNVSVPEGALPEGVELVVTPVSATSVVDQVNAVTEGEVTTNDIQAVDISFKWENPKTGKTEEVEPLKPISVKLASEKIREANNDLSKDASVVHIADNGATNVVPSVPVTTNQVAITSQDFSIYVVVSEGETGVNARQTVAFMNGENEIASMQVKQSDVDAGQLDVVLYDPGVPGLTTTQVFRGWTTDPNYKVADKDKGLTIDDVRNDIKNNYLPATEGADPVVYYAMVYTVYNVTYKSNESTVLETAPILVEPSGNTADYTINLDYTPATSDENFEGWFISPVDNATLKGGGAISANTPYPNRTDLTISGDIQLTVNAPAGHWLIFKENAKGASYTSPRFIKKGETTGGAPDDPVLLGYDFGGWYENEDCTGDPYTFGNPIEETTTLYVKWTPKANANYTVIIWKQNVKGDGYDFGTSVTLSGTTGSTINTVRQQGQDVNAYAQVRQNGQWVSYQYTGFHLDSFETGITIKPEGNSVVNVYYNRNTVTLTFRTANTVLQTMTGLYGSTLASNGYTWPSNYSWTAYSYGGQRTTFLDAFIPNNGSTTAQTFYRQTDSGSATIRFYKQNANGSGYDEANVVHADRNSRFEITDKYNGYHAASYSTNGTTWTNITAGNYPTVSYTSNLYIRFDADIYELEFKDGVFVDGVGNPIEGYSPRGEALKTEEVAYGSSLSSYGNFKPEFSNFVLEGWYLDDKCTSVKFDFNSNMPEGLVLYAKWVQVEYRVFLNPNVPTSDTSFSMGGQNTSFRIGAGGSINKITGYRVDDELVGWYMDEACTIPFNFDAYVLDDSVVTTPYDLNRCTETDLYGLPKYGENKDKNENRFWITHSLDLYAKWRSKLLGAEGIDVVYDKGEGDTAPTDSFKYKDKALAVAGTAATISDPDKVFSHWVIQKWNGTEFEDTDATVLPGDTFEVLKANAQAVEDPESTPDDPKWTYTVQLRAEYKPAEHATKTHIDWYANNGTPDVKNIEDVEYNANVDIEAADLFTYADHTFIGWGKAPVDPETGKSSADDAVMFLWYNQSDGEFYSDAAMTKEATYVAADEKSPYDDLYAMWAENVTVTITGSDKTVAYTGEEQSNDGYAVKYFVGGEEVASLPSGVTFTLDPAAPAAKGTEPKTYTQEVSGTLTSTNPKYAIPEDAVTAGTITLTIKPTSLTITKSTEGATTPDAATFTVKKGNETYETFTYADMDNGSKTLTNVPAGTYTVEESNADIDTYGLNTTYGDPVAISIDALTGEIAVTNVYTKLIADLTVSKTVTVPEGFDVDAKKSFKFTVTLDEALPADYEAPAGVTVDGTKLTFELKDKESVVLANLPVGVAYTVTETKEPGYEPDKNNVQGTLTKDGAEVAITNEYSVEDLIVNPADDKAKTVFGTKTVTAASAEAGATFTFTLDGKDAAGKAAPLPEPATAELTYAKNETGDPKPIPFGNITYTKPGVYTYSITEEEPPAGWKVSGSPATVKVTITDNGEGKLEAKVEGGAISNAYTPESDEIDTSDAKVGFAKKVVEANGDKWDAQTFEFTLAGVDADDNPAPSSGETAEVTADKAGDYVINFGTITFDKVGEYTYTVTEKPKGEIEGWTFGTKAIVKVKVTDDGEGSLTAAIDGEGAKITNAYNAEGADLITGDTATGFAKKVVEANGDNWDAQTFEFTLTGEDAAGNPAPSSGETAEVTATEADEYVIDFGTITFDKVGEYTYTVTEKKKEDGNGWTYAKDPATVIVKVTDDGKGHLSAAVDGSAATITNTYEAEPATVDTNDEAAPFLTKTVEGKDFKTGKTFGFSITAGEKAPAIAETATTDGFDEADSKTVDLGELTFPEIGIFTYTVVEDVPEGAVNNKLDGWTYDAEEKTITVEVTDNGKGQLEAEVTGVEFVNTYEPTPIDVNDKDERGNAIATKVVEGTGYKSKTFAFNIEPVGNAPKPASKDGNVTMDGEKSSDTVDFGIITFTEAGKFEYTVTETTESGEGWTNDTDTHTVTINVEDDGEGTLSATVTGVEITNKYKAVPVEIEDGVDAKGNAMVTKTVEGAGFVPTSFEFKIVANGDAPTPAAETVTSDEFTASGSKTVNVGNFTFEEVGEYTYTVTETTESGEGWTNETAAKDITVKVTDNGKGELEAVVTGVKFNNSYEAEPVVITGGKDARGNALTTKVITGESLLTREFTFTLSPVGGAPMPSSATATVIAEGDGSQAGNYVVEFGDITYSKAGTYRYTVAESAASYEGWTLDTSAKNITVTVTDNGKGELEAEVTGATITNAYNGNAELTVVKTVVSTNATYFPGDTINYNIAVSNTGNLTMYNVRVSDRMDNITGPQPILDTAMIQQLAPGATVNIPVSYTVQLQDVGRSIANTAIANALDPDDPGNVVTSEDTTDPLTPSSTPVPPTPPAPTPTPTPTPAAFVPPAPAAAVPATPAAPAVTPVADNPTPQAETVEDDGNALGNGGAWSLFDLVCTIVTTILAAIMLVFAIGRNRKDGDDEEAAAAKTANGEEVESDEVYKRKRLGRILSIIPAAGAIILFILTQDLTQPMVIFDWWSIAFAIIAIINIVLAVVTRKKTKDDDDEQQQAGYAPASA